jgi:hypothetical protein
MAAEPEHLLDSVTSRYAMGRNFFTRALAFVRRSTFQIDKGSPAETIDSIGREFPLDDAQRKTLSDLAATKDGAAFIEEKAQAMNRAAFHRSAFALNAFVQLGFVDLAAQVSASLPQLKLALVAANLVIAAIAHMERRDNLQALLAGPNALPPRRRLWGLFPNPNYNRAVKKSSHPYAKSAWKENSLYRPAYFANAATIFLGGQFILPPERLIFPFGFILGKITGLFTTLITVFDVWRGVKAGDDARLAREREVSVYRDLDI